MPRAKRSPSSFAVLARVRHLPHPLTLHVLCTCRASEFVYARLAAPCSCTRRGSTSPHPLPFSSPPFPPPSLPPCYCSPCPAHTSSSSSSVPSPFLLPLPLPLPSLLPSYRFLWDVCTKRSKVHNRHRSRARGAHAPLNNTSFPEDKQGPINP